MAGYDIETFEDPFDKRPKATDYELKACEEFYRPEFTGQRVFRINYSKNRKL